MAFGKPVDRVDLRPAALSPNLFRLALNPNNKNLRQGGLVQTQFILIDFENVQPEALAMLEEPGFKAMVFAGANQTKVPLELAAALQRMGDRAKYLRIGGNGRNALDFHIAFYIGELAAAQPSARFWVVSKDKGFDPLIQHLRNRNIEVNRVADLAQVTSTRKIPSTEDRIAEVVAKLRSLNGGRPRTVKTLSNTIASLFRKQLGAEEIDAIVQALKRTGSITVKDNKVGYVLP